MQADTGEGGAQQTEQGRHAPQGAHVIDDGAGLGAFGQVQHANALALLVAEDQPVLRIGNPLAVVRGEGHLRVRAAGVEALDLAVGDVGVAQELHAVDHLVGDDRQADQADHAEQQAARGTYDPEYLNYTLNKLLILKLRDDWTASRGGRKAWKQFHDTFLSYGGPPVPLVRQAMMGETTPRTVF